jgi:proteasome lid subunit RPN8/RPN11
VRVTIPAEVIADMLAHARQEVPRECCGLLIGHDRTVVRAVRATNRDDVPTRRYLIDPADHFAAIRSARVESKEVIGAYHSHPAGTAVPSTTDLAEANSGPDFLYVIVSPMSGEVRAYRYEGKGFTPYALTLAPSA